ncbi:Imm26 family immunity protein [Ammoniphilus sp. 3BR4]|uniref:Imm26 family immunity protein n=1 Tax=Ammoniphilus sp. 3BR4 TaxID=3158265 RepID=UPI003466ECD5
MGIYKRTKPQKWKVGDVFSIPLSDGTFSFGQVLWAEYRSSPNCALFDCRSKEILPIEKIIAIFATAFFRGQVSRLIRME